MIENMVYILFQSMFFTASKQFLFGFLGKLSVFVDKFEICGDFHTLQESGKFIQ